jgi:hypothetical protein
MAGRSLNKNPYSSFYGPIASGSTSLINPDAVNSGINAVSNVANRGGGPGTGNLGLNNGGNVTSPGLSSVQNMAKLVSAPTGGGFTAGGSGTTTFPGDIILQKAEEGEPTTLPVLSAVTGGIKSVEAISNGKPNGDPDVTTTKLTATTKDRITPDQVYDAQGNFLSAGMTISPGGPGSSDRAAREKQRLLERAYLMQEAPGSIVDSLGNLRSSTMMQGKDPEKSLAKNEDPPTPEEAADFKRYEIQLGREERWFANARRDKLGFSPSDDDVPDDTIVDAGDAVSDDVAAQFEADIGSANVPGKSLATVVGTDESGKEIVEVGGSTVLASEDDWTQDAFQNAWAEVQKGGGVPSWAIRTVRVPYRTLDPETGDIVTIMRSEISPQTQTLLDENARLAGIRQTSESQRLGQYAAILQNPRAAAAMRIMEQMGLGGIAQLLGTPQTQQAAPSMPGMDTDMLLQAQEEMGTPIVPGRSIQSQLLPEGMTEEQLRLRQMWGGGMIPTTGFLSGADPDRLLISQALQQIAGFSPEQTFQSSVGVTPGVDKGYNIPRLLAMRR